MAMRKKGLSQSGSGETVGEVSEIQLDLSYFDKMKARGIPVCKAAFRAAVDNADNVPCENFCLSSHNKDRRPDAMWWINGDGLLCLQRGKYFFAPTGTVIHIKFVD